MMTGSRWCLPVDECERLLRAAEAFESGKLVPYVALCLFGGLRPFEAARLTWEQVNLVDKEIRLKGAADQDGQRTNGRDLPDAKGVAERGTRALMKFTGRLSTCI